jgi:ABC-type phosphate/phosphonate transport system ATPase subunit
VIELLGVGVPRVGGGWLLRQTCVRVEAGSVTAVLAARPDEGGAFMDAIAGRVIPSEGRVWIDRVPLMPRTVRRIRTLVGDISPHGLLSRRSVLWNTLVDPATTLAGLLRVPRRGQRRAALRALEEVGLGARYRDAAGALGPADATRVGLARCVTHRTRAVLLRDVDAACGDAAGDVLSLARALARAHGLALVVSLGSSALAQAHTDRIVAIARGDVVFDVATHATTGPASSEPLGLVAR